MQSTLVQFGYVHDASVATQWRDGDDAGHHPSKVPRLHNMVGSPCPTPTPRFNKTRVESMYEIPTGELSRSDIRRHTEALTMVPKDAYISAENASFPAFTLTDNVLRVPRWYGNRVFGPASQDCTQLGIQLSEQAALFKGSLQPHQVKPIDSVMDVYLDESMPSPRGGMMCLACGQGKTVCALNIASRMKRKTLVLCHKTFLVDQWMERASAFLPNAKLGIIRQGTAEIDADVVIASLQSVAMRNYSVGTFDGFGLLIIDEAHHLSAPCLSRALQKLSMRYVLALSATPERRDGLTPLLYDSMGPIIYRAERPRERVLVSRLVYVNRAKQTEMLGRDNKPAFAVMVNRLAEDIDRTALVAKHLHLHMMSGRQIIILSDRIHQLERVSEAVVALGVNPNDVALYIGRCTAAEREAASTKQMILSTFSLAREGLDLARLDTLCLLSPSSSVEQAVGRILRPNNEKNTPLVLDVVDPYSLFARMSQKRLKYYSSRSYEIQDVQLLG